jgi:hypothetical protein
VFHAFGAGLDGRVRALWFDAAPTRTGLHVGGDFRSAGFAVAVAAAMLAAPCPASATALGQPCANSLALASLTAAAPPWLGATFRASAAPIPPTAIVAIAIGTQQLALPLAAVVPAAAPDCTLLVAPDAVAFGVPSGCPGGGPGCGPGGGIATWQTALPNDPTLVGAAFLLQFAVLELGAGPVWLRSSSTNALRLVAGTF